MSVVPAPPACASVGSTATISGSGYGLSSGPIQVWIDQTQVVNTTPSSVQVKSRDVDGIVHGAGTVDGQQVTKQTTYPLYGIGLPDRSSTRSASSPPPQRYLWAGPIPPADRQRRRRRLLQGIRSGMSSILPS